MNKFSKIVRGTVWSAIGVWGRRLIGFVVFAILARHVKQESLGLAALSMVYIAFIEMLSRQGIGMAIIQRKEVNPDLLNTAFYLNMVTAAILVTLNITFAPQIAALLGEPALSPIIRLLSLVVIASASNVAPIALQSRAFDFRSIAFQSFLGTAVAAAVSIPMAIMGFEVYALAVQSITFAVVNSATIWIRTKWRPRWTFDKNELKTLTSFSVKILLNNLINFLRIRFDQVLIGIALGPVGLGLYALGLKIGETIESLIKGPIDQVAVPAFSRIQGNRTLLQSALTRSFGMNAAISLPVFAGLALLSPEAIALAFGDRWLQAATICAILTLRQLAGNLFFLTYHVFVSQGFPGTHTTIQFFQVAGLIISTWVGKAWGVEGVAIASLINVVVFNIISVAMLSRLVRIPVGLLLLPVGKPALAALVMTGTIQIVRLLQIFEKGSILSALLLVTSGMVSYTVALKIASPDTFSELLSLRHHLRKEKSGAARLQENVA